MKDMENDKLILYQKTGIAENSHREDLFALYGIPNLIDKVVAHEKDSFLANFIEVGDQLGVVGTELHTLFNSKELMVEIPGHLKDMLLSGKAVLDKSTIIEGNLTPNIRILGKKGIAGQVTLKEGVNKDAVANSLANLAMLAMVQTILAKLDGIEEKIDDVKTGQMNDRIAEVIAAFKSFCDLYPTFTSADELNREISQAYGKMQAGLVKLHLQIEEERNKLKEAPSDVISALKFTVKNLFVKDAIDKQRSLYGDYIRHINVYYRLNLLADLIVSLKGGVHIENLIRKNHEIISRYINEFHGSDFINRMKYLLNKDPKEIIYLQHLSESLEFDKIGFNETPFQIEFLQSK